MNAQIDLQQPGTPAVDIPNEARMIELQGISKSFGPVKANQDINLTVERGKIHGIVGENGAGKSTLMSILYGFYHADRGSISINGALKNINNPQDAIKAGIGMVHQHFMLVATFSVLDNIILGEEKDFVLKKTRDAARAKINALADEYEMHVDLDAITGELSVGLQQRVEILKALYREADLLILDEPTGVLTPSEADHLFRILDQLRAQGKTIIIITHKLREIMAITDTVSVMRRGKMSPSIWTKDTNPKDLAKLMVGRDVVLKVDKEVAKPTDVVLSVEELSVSNQLGVQKLKELSLTIRAGEILGVAGVAGNGQTELLEILAGMAPAGSGSVKYLGEPLDISKTAKPDQRRRRGIGHIPEDRHKRGLVKPFKTWENTAFGYHNFARFASKFGFANQKFMREDAADKMERFDIRPRNINLQAANFSGGNQQKIVCAREIDQAPKLILIGQPTRGVDIGAIEFIHKEIIRMRDEGAAVLLISVELDEILSLSDRVIVLLDGKIVGERETAKTDVNDLGLLMAGIEEKEAVNGQ